MFFLQTKRYVIVTRRNEWGELETYYIDRQKQRPAEQEVQRQTQSTCLWRNRHEL